MKPGVGLLVAAGVTLASCEAANEELRAQRWIDRQAAIDPPALWLTEVVDTDPSTGPVRVCADSVLRTGFDQPMPTFGGRPCQRLGDPVVGPGYWAARCETGGSRYAVTSTTTGDPAAAFTVRMAVRKIGGDRQGWEQTRTYRRLGGCPEGWRIGDRTDQKGRRLSDAVG